MNGESFIYSCTKSIFYKNLRSSDWMVSVVMQILLLSSSQETFKKHLFQRKKDDLTNVSSI